MIINLEQFIYQDQIIYVSYVPPYDEHIPYDFPVIALWWDEYMKHVEYQVNEQWQIDWDKCESFWSADKLLDAEKDIPDFRDKLQQHINHFYKLQALI